MYYPVQDLMLRIANRRKIDKVNCWEVGFSWGSATPRAYEKFYLKGDGTFDQIGWDFDIPAGGTAVPFYLEEVTPLAEISALSQPTPMITSMVASAPTRNPSLYTAQPRTGSTLSELCVAAGIDATAPFSALRSLHALVGSKNLLCSTSATDSTNLSCRIRRIWTLLLSSLTMGWIWKSTRHH